MILLSKISCEMMIICDYILKNLAKANIEATMSINL